MKKYILTNETQKFSGKRVHRIRAAKDFGTVKKGDIGGWVEAEKNLTQTGFSWIGGNAIVVDNAVVRDNAVVEGHALICDNAKILGDSHIGGNSVISGNTTINGKSSAFGNSIVINQSAVCGNAVSGIESNKINDFDDRIHACCNRIEELAENFLAEFSRFL